MTKILITGGNGFISRSIAEYLQNKYFFPLKNNIYITTRKDLDLLNSIDVYNFLKKHKFDVIIHSATYDPGPTFSDKDGNKQIEMNLRMFFNLVKCEKYFNKLIYFGSGAEKDIYKIPTEQDFIDCTVLPTRRYGFSKYVMNMFSEKSDKIINLRLFGVFGKYDDWRYRTISNMCCKAVFDMPLIINKNKTIGCIDVNDLSKVVYWAIENSPTQKSYNVISTTITYEEIANFILKISNKKLNIEIKNDFHEIYTGVNDSLLSEIQYMIEFKNIYKSITELYNWYFENKNIINPELFEY